MLGGEPNGLISSETLRPHWGGRLGTSAWLHPLGIWTSRRLRKGHGPLRQKHYQALNAIEMLRALLSPKELKRLETLTALAFIIGPLLFALGSWLQLHTSQSPALALGLLAFGSVFFTAGGWWQLQQAWIGEHVLQKRWAAMGVVWPALRSHSKHWHGVVQHRDLFQLEPAATKR